MSNITGVSQSNWSNYTFVPDNDPNPPSIDEPIVETLVGFLGIVSTVLNMSCGGDTPATSTPPTEERDIRNSRDVRIIDSEEADAAEFDGAEAECEIGETRTTYRGREGTAGAGECRARIEACMDINKVPSFVTIQEQITPRPEGCDGLDNDCDWETDEDGVCAEGDELDAGLDVSDADIVDATDSSDLVSDPDIIYAEEELDMVSEPEECIEWNRTFGGPVGDWIESVQQTADDGFILAGSTFSFGAGGQDTWLIKTDSLGNEVWNRTFGGARRDTGRSVLQVEDGGFILTGETESYGAGEFDLWLIKTDSWGNEEWSRTFGGSSYDYASSVQQTNDGGYILAGSTTFSSEGFPDFWLIKTDTLGNEEWSRTFGGSSYDYAHSVQQTDDGGYIITGGTQSYGAGNWDIWLIKTDSYGNEE